MSRLGEAWHGVTRIGVDVELPAAEAKYIVLTNAIALTAVLIVVAYMPVMFVFGTPPLIALTLAQIVVWVAPLGLNRLRLHWLATSTLVFGGLVVFAGQSFLFGAQYGHHHFVLGVAVGAMLAYPPRHALSMAVAVSLAGAAFLGIVAFEDRIVPLYGALPAPAAFARTQILLGVFASLAALSYASRRSTLAAEEQVEIDRRKSENLLLNILPASIAARLKESPASIADGLAEVTVLFADIGGFTQMSERMTPEETVQMLNRVFSRLDRIADAHGLEKIKTIGDAYMAAAGLPSPRADHAEAVAEMALETLAAVSDLRGADGAPLRVRIGMHSGAVVAGVIGERKFSYDVWGDTVNTASRMESHGIDGAIQVTAGTYERLKHRYAFERRGPIPVKGKGEMITYLLVGRLPTA